MLQKVNKEQIPIQKEQFSKIKILYINTGDKRINYFNWGFNILIKGKTNKV